MNSIDSILQTSLIECRTRDESDQRLIPVIAPIFPEICKLANVIQGLRQSRETYNAALRLEREVTDAIRAAHLHGTGMRSRLVQSIKICHAEYYCGLYAMIATFPLDTSITVPEGWITPGRVMQQCELARLPWIVPGAGQPP